MYNVSTTNYSRWSEPEKNSDILKLFLYLKMYYMFNIKQFPIFLFFQKF